jgi:iron complex transport system ATP-binding protein
MSILNIHQLSFRYGSKIVLDGVTFSVDSGEFIGIAGLNGSGKTTLLKLLQRIYSPASGGVEFHGTNLQSYSHREFAKKVASVAQRPLFDFPFLVEEFVLLGRTPYLNFLKRETSADKEAVEEALRQSDSLQFAGRSISQLSAGELQRVCIAAALAQQPEVLLLDEPTSALDLKQVGRLSRLLSNLQNDGLTILCASHDLNFLKKHCTKILLLHEGKQAGFGKYEEVLSDEVLFRLFEVEEVIHAR